LYRGDVAKHRPAGGPIADADGAVLGLGVGDQAHGAGRRTGREDK
jgi:hypothetical protein